ncbi:MAG TPA: hypothetical protein VGE69_00970 [Pseudomonadales bacterium]
MPKFQKHDPGVQLSRDERERRQALRDPLLRREQVWVDAQIDAVKNLEEAKAIIKKLARAVRAMKPRAKGK